MRESENAYAKVIRRLVSVIPHFRTVFGHSR